MALPVARKLGASLHLHVWDPLSWWHDAHRVDRFNAWLDQATFNRTMRAGVSCASASWAMTEHFSRLYGVRGEPVIAALPVGWRRCPPPHLHSANELVIGMAGQFYAREEWLTLVKALSDVGWEVAGRRVVLRVMGGDPPPGEIPQDRLDFLGWRSQKEVLEILSDRCDVLYCGYPFSPEMAEVARFSFPSKLPTFFCAGRPVLFHGPVVLCALRLHLHVGLLYLAVHLRFLHFNLKSRLVTLNLCLYLLQLRVSRRWLLGGHLLGLVRLIRQCIKHRVNFLAQLEIPGKGNSLNYPEILAALKKKRFKGLGFLGKAVQPDSGKSPLSEILEAKDWLSTTGLVF
jgi:hypothetical protein